MPCRLDEQPICSKIHSEHFWISVAYTEIICYIFISVLQKTTSQANHFLQVRILFPSEPFLDFSNHQKTFLVQPRVSQCRAVLYSVAGSKHQQFRQFSSGILGLLVLLIWTSALFTLATLFWFVQKRGRNQRIKWLAAVKPAVTRTSFSATCTR